MSFDHTNISVVNYYFVVDENGDAYTDTGNRARARIVAQNLANDKQIRFYVYDHSGIIYTAIPVKVNLRKDSFDQKMAFLIAHIENVEREDNLRGNYALFVLLGGRTIDYRKRNPAIDNSDPWLNPHAFAGHEPF